MREWAIIIRYIIFSGSKGVDYNNPLYYILQEVREWTIIIRYVMFSGSEGVDYNNPLFHIFRR